MKQKRRFCKRVLASLMLLAVSLSCAFNGNAQITYRGFVEGGLGASVITGASGSESSGPNGTYGFKESNYGGGVGLSYMLATTHGIQLKNNFFGIGLGITPGHCAAGNYYYYNKSITSTSVHEVTLESLSEPRMTKVSIPAYVNWRYDFFNTNGSFKPYVGVKAGIFLPVPEFELKYRYAYSYVYTSSSLSDTYSDEELRDVSSGFLPFFAIDLGLRKRMSESSGVSFGLSIQTSNNAKAYMDPDFLYSSDCESIMGISILAKVAFDF